MTALLEYALGGSDASPSAGLPWSLARDDAGFTFTFTRRLNADDVIYILEASNDLLVWVTATTQIVSRTYAGEVLTETHRILARAPGESRLFVRLRATAR
jgi:hypothetical protein